MNKRDRGNLKFLLEADKETMDEWYQTATQDDIDYAMELLQKSRTQLELRFLKVIDKEAEADLSEAQAVLSRFTL